MAIGLGFQWKGNVTRLAPLLEVAERELYFYGITLFHIGIGVLVSKKVRLTKRVPDVKPRAPRQAKSRKASRR